MHEQGPADRLGLRRTLPAPSTTPSRRRPRSIKASAATRRSEATASWSSSCRSWSMTALQDLAADSYPTAGYCSAMAGTGTTAPSADERHEHLDEGVRLPQQRQSSLPNIAEPTRPQAPSPTTRPWAPPASPVWRWPANTTRRRPYGTVDHPSRRRDFSRRRQPSRCPTFSTGFPTPSFIMETIDDSNSRWMLGSECALTGLPGTGAPEPVPSVPTGQRRPRRTTISRQPHYRQHLGRFLGVSTAGLQTFLMYDFSPQGADARRPMQTYATWRSLAPLGPRPPTNRRPQSLWPVVGAPGGGRCRHWRRLDPDPLQADRCRQLVLPDHQEQQRSVLHAVAQVERRDLPHFGNCKEGSPKSMYFMPWKKMLGGYQSAFGLSVANFSLSK